MLVYCTNCVFFLQQHTQIQTHSNCFTQIGQFFEPILVNFTQAKKNFLRALLVIKSTSDLDAT